MFEQREDESGDAIDRPAIYRTLVFAFGVWSAHFLVSYGAVLIFPGQPIARFLAVGGGIAALAALAWKGQKLPRPRPPIALGALGLAVAAVAFGTFPALIG